MKRLIMFTFALTMILTLSIGGTSFAIYGNMQPHDTTAIVENGSTNNQQGDTRERIPYFVRWHHRPVLHRLFHCMRDLNLSDETKQSIKDLLADYKEEAMARWEVYNEARKEYWEKLTAPVLDEAALTAAEDAIVAIKNENMTAKFDLAYAIRGLLTDEEIAQLSTCFDFSTDEDQSDDLADDLDSD